MGRHSNHRAHQAGHNRATLAALIAKLTDAPTQPMTIVLDVIPDHWIEPAPIDDEWVHPETWLAQHSGSVVA